MGSPAVRERPAANGPVIRVPVNGLILLGRIAAAVTLGAEVLTTMFVGELDDTEAGSSTGTAATHVKAKEEKAVKATTKRMPLIVILNFRSANVL